MKDFVEVAVPLPVYQCYTYQVPEQLQSAVEVGKRVLVPFGPRKMTAYVLGAPGEVPEGTRIKSIVDVLDDQPLFPASMAAFFRWMADYYIHPIGEVIQTALPAGLVVAEKTVYGLTDAGGGVSLKAVWRIWPPRLLKSMDRKPCRYDQLVRAAKGGVLRAQLNRWIDSGWVTKETAMMQQRARSRTDRFVSVASVVPRTRRLSVQREKILGLLRAQGEVSLADLKQQVPTAGNLVRAMARDGQVRIEDRVVFRDLLGESIAPDRAPDLTAEQSVAVDRISSVFGQRFRTFLLAGVTGSGKTEVYLQPGRRGPQKKKCRCWFSYLRSLWFPRWNEPSGPVSATVWPFCTAGCHLASATTSGAVSPAGIRASPSARGRPYLHPFERLGLVIVDEEHDDSYKQEGALRYNARDLAVVRARKDGAIAILGSATPSLQSTYNVSIGKYEHIALHQRIDQRTLPSVTLQDLTPLREERGVRRFLTPGIDRCHDGHPGAQRTSVALPQSEGVCQCPGMFRLRPAPAL